ncbi:MAG: hypothetical protein ACFFDF_11060 [Candidatus Odinarchaeota archaeon]
MSEEEKFNSIIQEIKDIYLYLTTGEPTPDDEITARERLINQIQTLISVKTSDAEKNRALFEDTLNKLDNWDTLELWFLESELPESVEQIIKIKDELPEIETPEVVKESPTARIHQDLETASFDIDQIVNKVSKQFKGEIDDLKHKIDILKTELERKDESLQQLSHKKVIKKIIPKKDVKLPPPKIKLPVIKKPDKPPQIKTPRRTEAEKPKKVTGITSIEQVQTKIEQKLEKQKIPSNLEQKPKINEDLIQKIQEEKIISAISKDKESILDILDEYETSPEPKEPQNFSKLPEKPKKVAIVPEIIEVESSEKEKEIPFTTKEHEIAKEPSIEEAEIPEEPTIEQPEIAQKSTFITTPRITSVSIEEIEAEKIRSTGTELFNVFSSVGEKSTEKLPTLDESFISPSTKNKKKKKDEKSAISFVGFNESKSKISKSTESETGVEEEMPSDKDSLYQELIALEGKRYSLEKAFKDLEKTYSTGTIDDFEYNNQSDDLRSRLNNITSKINKIRRIISSL